MVRDALARFGKSVQPLIWEHESSDAPYFLRGTGFLVGHPTGIHVITCRHVVDGEHLAPLCFFVDETSQSILPLKSVNRVPPELVTADWADIATIEVDFERARGTPAGTAVLIDIERASIGWERFRETSDFFVLGYPGDRSEIDYDTKTISTNLITLPGRYAGPTETDHVHAMSLDSTGGLNSLSGLSGSPVVCWAQQVGVPPQLVFCGIAVQGTVGSNLIRFVEAHLVLHAIVAWSALGKAP